jgi:hypothetical protein
VETTFLAYSSTLKTEAMCLSETSLHFQRTTRRYSVKGRTFDNHRCDNLILYDIKYWHRSYQALKRLFEKRF